jgi:uncharacterized protein (DUF2147 family)
MSVAAGRRWPLRAALLAAALLSASLGGGTARAQQGPVGLWESVSDVDGKPKAHIRIREIDGELRGVVEAILDPRKRGAICDKCTDERRNQPVLGLTIITGMHRESEAYTGGRILDPDDGNVYSCRITVIDGGRRLQVRGFLGFSLFGRSQTWNRLE